MKKKEKEKKKKKKNDDTTGIRSSFSRKFRFFLSLVVFLVEVVARKFPSKRLLAV